MFYYASWTSAPCGPLPAGTGFPSGASYYIGSSWCGAILPQLEMQSIYDMFDWSLTNGATSGTNFTAGGHRVDAFICPSDPNGKEYGMVAPGSAQPGRDPDEDSGPTNIAGVSDMSNFLCDPNYPKQFPWVTGIFGNVQCCRVSDVKDGLSNTLMLAEATGGESGTNTNFVWVVIPLIDTLDGINGPYTIPGGGAFAGGRSAAGASSYHPGGCNVALGDGSAHFFSQNIAANVLDAMTTRNGVGIDQVIISGAP